jgi:hypothetical protein
MPRAKQQMNTTDAMGRCRFMILTIFFRESKNIASGRLGAWLESGERLLICSISVNSPSSCGNRPAEKVYEQEHSQANRLPAQGSENTQNQKT